VSKIAANLRTNRAATGGCAIAFVIAALLFAAGLRLEAATPDPVAIVHSIYDGASKREMAFGLDPAERHKFLSKSTAALWNLAEAKSNPNGDEIGAIDFDITTNTQGADVKSYSVVSNKVSGKTATVVVKLELDNWIRNSPDDLIIRYNFVLEDGSWLIDDMGSTTNGKPWTLREILEINSRDRTRSQE
jgi:hypothetical protein